MSGSISNLPSGTMLGGKYQIKSIIGVGGMGTVYEAIQVDLGRRVAVKHLHHEYSTDQRAIQRFHQEAQLAASIGHDNICEVTDFGRTVRGSPYLVMPLLSGSSLGDLLKKEQRLDVSRLVDIVDQTLVALQAAHDAHIVHRDLKPDNIFVSKLGDRDDFVRLLDFGISKVMGSDAAADLHQTSAVLGTPFYMAPEQALGADRIDYRVDIYAAGVILYEGLTGQKPFEGRTYNEVIYKILTDTPCSPGILAPAIPETLSEIIMRAMSRNANDRYANVSEMLCALRNGCQPAVINPAPLVDEGNRSDAEPVLDIDVRDIPVAADKAVPSLGIPVLSANGKMRSQRPSVDPFSIYKSISENITRLPQHYLFITVGLIVAAILCVPMETVHLPPPSRLVTETPTETDVPAEVITGDIANNQLPKAPLGNSKKTDHHGVTEQSSDDEPTTGSNEPGRGTKRRKKRTKKESLQPQKTEPKVWLEGPFGTKFRPTFSKKE